MNHETLSRVLESLKYNKSFKSFRSSDIYSTIGIGSGVGLRYLNAVACIKSTCSTEEMEQVLKKIEKKYGRRDNDKEVILDLDLVEADNIVRRPKDFEHAYYTIGRKELT